jgi:5'-3' exonuclease
MLDRITSPAESERSRMDVHLIDGTYELFRHFFAVPASAAMDGQEIGATRGVLNSVLSMIERGATHIGVATDHVVESFRNDLYPGYKTSEGVPPELLSQFPILEEALVAMVWWCGRWSTLRRTMRLLPPPSKRRRIIVCGRC